MRRLSGLDAAFLYAETTAWHMHVSALLIVDPSTSQGRFDFEAVKQLTVDRLPDLPQFRWRAVEVPFGLDRPVWVEADDFDADYHIRRIGVPAPGGAVELFDLVGHLIGYKLDRSRPLWEMWVIDGLEDGNVAVLTKMHHAIVDGVSGAGLAEILLDFDPTSERTVSGVRDSLHHHGSTNQWRLFGQGLANAAFATPWRMAQYGVQLARKGVTLAGMLRSDRPPTTPFQTPRTRFNGPITPHRSFAASSVPLERVKAIKRAYDVKLNDVILALCAGALREYLGDELPDDPLVAQVPVSLRVEGDAGVGTKVGPMFTSLATDIADPIKRLLAIHDATTRAKEMRNALSADGIKGLTETTPPGLLSLAARMYSAAGLEQHGPPLYNLIISNVPGPAFPLYLSGAELVRMYPMGPLILGGGLNITVFSYQNNLDFGFLTCPETAPEPERIAVAIPTALEELERGADLDPAALRFDQASAGSVSPANT